MKPQPKPEMTQWRNEEAYLEEGLAGLQYQRKYQPAQLAKMAVKCQCRS